MLILFYAFCLFEQAVALRNGRSLSRCYHKGIHSQYSGKSVSLCRSCTFCTNKLFSNKRNEDIETPYLSALISAEENLKDSHRFFFPGHGGGHALPEELTFLASKKKSIFSYDLPELDGTDNVHNPEGPLLDALQLAADLFGASFSWFLVNGSTSGILTAILATTRIFKSERLNPETVRTCPIKNRPVFLISRDAHKSVFDALPLAGSEIF